MGVFTCGIVPANAQAVTTIPESDLLLVLVALGVVLLAGRGAGELARRFDQPEVLGQLVAGFLLGPSVFGALLPHVYHVLLQGKAVGFSLSIFSWVGVMLLLLAAGQEIDLEVLPRVIGPGVLAAVGAIVPALVAGTAFAWLVLGMHPPYGIFLGIVLSVTGMSVVSRILIESEATRRHYAQVIISAGVVSEVVVWLFVSTTAALHTGSPVLAGIRSSILAVAFFVFAVTVGRRSLFWGMRRVTDRTGVGLGPLTFILALTFLSAALTQALGLHALLGPFAIGVLLSRSPRATRELLGGISTLTVSLFAPIFFVLAGMRVDIFQLGSVGVVGLILLLLLVATAVKVGMAALGARLGGLRTAESILVGVGLNVKGGTDMVVAIVGAQLGLLTGRVYSMYAVVAIVTVLVSPSVMRFLARRTPPTEVESERMERKEAESRAYLPGVERVMVPLVPSLIPSLAAGVVKEIAASKGQQGETFDIVELELQAEPDPVRVGTARGRLEEAERGSHVQLTRESGREDDPVDAVLAAAEGFDLVAIGARPSDTSPVSLGEMQDRLIDGVPIPVLVAMDRSADCFEPGEVRRILAPINGLEYSLAAGDVAASLAQACGADLCVLHVVASTEGTETRTAELEAAAGKVVDEVAFRARRLGVRVDTRVEVAPNPADVIDRELQEDGYGLLVMGAVDRGRDGRLYLGSTVERALTAASVPTVLLIAR